jgi:hypothetical protein
MYGNVNTNVICSLLFKSQLNSIVSNAFLKTTVRNNVSVLDFIEHYLLHVSAPIGGHTINARSTHTTTHTTDQTRWAKTNKYIIRTTLHLIEPQNSLQSHSQQEPP